MHQSPPPKLAGHENWCTQCTIQQTFQTEMVRPVHQSADRPDGNGAPGTPFRRSSTRKWCTPCTIRQTFQTDMVHHVHHSEFFLTKMVHHVRHAADVPDGNGASRAPSWTSCSFIHVSPARPHRYSSVPGVQNQPFVIQQRTAYSTSRCAG